MESRLQICILCLSKYRRLVPLSNIRHVIEAIYLFELKNVDGNACWECYRNIMKFYRFKMQVKKAQESIVQVDRGMNIKSLSKLSWTPIYMCDFEDYHDFDPLNSAKLENDSETKPLKEETKLLKEETKLLKEETSLDSLENDAYDSADSDNKAISNIVKKVKENIENKGKQRRALKRKVPQTNIDINNEMQEKFEVLVLSDEEMTKCREEKRSQPNFKKIPFKCDSCVLGFTRKENYDVHMKKKHDESIGEYTCKVCLVRFSSKRTMDKHHKKHFTLRRCMLCAYTTTEYWSALQHCRLKHPADSRGRIHCQECDSVYKTPEELADHKKTAHTLICNECGDKFKGKHTLRTHIS